MKNLRQRIGQGIAYTAIGLGSLALSGCEMPEDQAQATAIFGTMAQVSPYSSAGTRVAGAGLSTAGQMSHDMNAAQAGRSQVNVYVNESNNTNSAIPKDYFIITDVNGDEEMYVGNVTEYIKAHPKKYMFGWKIKEVKDGKAQDGYTKSMNWDSWHPN